MAKSKFLPRRLFMKTVPLHCLVALLASLPGAAAAQYAWIDANGVRQYSDLPPPPSVPEARILKGMPGRGSANAAPAAAAVPASPAENAKGGNSLSEKNAEFLKRRAEQAEKEKKAAAEEKLAADRARNCERAQGYLRILESDRRVAHIASNGERAFLTDEQRARELSEARRAVRDCKG